MKNTLHRGTLADMQAVRRPVEPIPIIRAKRQLGNTILIVLVVLLLIGAFPLYGFHPHAGYGAGGLGTVLLVVLIVLLIRG